MVSDPGMTHEICDDRLFDKAFGGGLRVIQNSIAGTGLFTSPTNSPDWASAHEILMAPFSQQAMRGYMPRMLDIADQLMDKWSRLNSGDSVDVAGDMTATTLDTIALCGFDYRFNSLHRETPHPFVQALMHMLSTAQARASRPRFITRLRVREQRTTQDDQAYMRALVQSLIDRRRAQGDAVDNSDLLGLMLTGVDKHGVRLSEDNIIAQCITFLVAGHETTSGLLSFAIYELIKHPEAIRPARAQVDEVLGDTGSPTYEQVRELTCVLEILEETLRLCGPAPMFTRAPRQDTVIGWL
jgi:cytochrome P450/NADPH-cytochrome P450 reductase